MTHGPKSVNPVESFIIRLTKAIPEGFEFFEIPRGAITDITGPALISTIWSKPAERTPNERHFAPASN